jgi:tRNA (guanine-N7-)-methyltransferase
VTRLPPGDPARIGGTRTQRSFALRRRTTAGQAAALERLLPSYAVVVDGRPLDQEAVWGRRAPLLVEVGAGTGEATVGLAAADPDRDVLAIDVHLPGLGALLAAVERAGLTNVRVADGDARVVLRDLLAPDSLAGVRVFFPDPWPKTRHAKRRLLDAAFVELVTSRLEPGGLLHVATDWAPYAEQIRELLAASALQPVEAPPRPLTRFERRGLAAGRQAHDLAAVKAA